jgi:phosphoribosylformimino-5-aminoimidazole carboxamide ribotide isomerase
MIVIPSIELRGGSVVRPTRNTTLGDMGISDHPVGVARAFANAGFQLLQIVDLDDKNGCGVNDNIMESIIRDGALDIQVCGDVHSTDQIERFADAGAVRVVLDSRAIEEPRWLATVAELFPGLLVVVTDVHARRVVTRGWVRSLPLDIFDVVEDLDGLPLGGLLLSSVANDAHRSPSDLSLLEDIADACEFPVMTTGGMISMADLRALEHRGIAAVLLECVHLGGELDARAVAQEYGR